MSSAAHLWSLVNILLMRKTEVCISRIYHIISLFSPHSSLPCTNLVRVICYLHWAIGGLGKPNVDIRQHTVHITVEWMQQRWILERKHQESLRDMYTRTREKTRLISLLDGRDMRRRSVLKVFSQTKAGLWHLAAVDVGIITCRLSERGLLRWFDRSARLDETRVLNNDEVITYLAGICGMPSGWAKSSVQQD